MSLDAHERPPEHIRNVYKKYQKLRGNALNNDPELLDLRDGNAVDQLRVVRSLAPADLRSAFQNFAATEGSDSFTLADTPLPVYEHRHMPGRRNTFDASSPLPFLTLPGLHIVPSLFPDSIQRSLLSRLIHRDLANPAHQTNVHLHYHVPYPPESLSFFEHPPSSEPQFLPKDPQVHKPLSMTQFLNRKLRWVTLGGQYDWTRKVYPPTKPPPFPADVGALLKGVFPEMTAQAAIVNFYSPGDTLSMHRDVSEECDRGLVSISVGCDGVFVIGRNACSTEGASGKSQALPEVLAVRLRSGDAVYMSGESRFAWHGVPQIIPDTCPEWLRDWPASSQNPASTDANHPYEQWKGWMHTKRINVNVRQMWE
ncbi:alkylated dna repair protein [Diplodia corticola]|uniref:mRNA N(6)-methyladenine demethylase n=1 Tax=Diplodia corticola TaxID=236234 RepID=A0A1J9R7N7_9PEZI|nr:alkylated dna repair protein [Diplodia corticola]OJD36600.1 alkylated dna repair protein [Diplodia corticola]